MSDAAPSRRTFEDRRTFLTAGAADYALHMLLGAVTYRARELGASQGELGLVGASGDFVYMIGCLAFAGLSDRFGRRRCVRGAVVAFLAAGLLAWSAKSLPVLVTALVVQRIAASIFWPTIQGRLADQSTDLGRDAGLFNLSWSVGKTAGYLTNFVLFDGFGLPTASAFLASGMASLAIGLAAPPDRARRAERAPLPRATPAEEAVAVRYVLPALMGNFAGCAAFTVVQNQASALMAARGLDKGVGSFVTACFVVAQFGAFLLMTRRHALVGRPGLLFVATAAILAGLGAFAAASRPVAVAAAAALLGLGAGLAYAQAMLLSLRLPAGATKGAGRHEAVIGLANAVTAPSVGFVADLTRRTDDALVAAAGIAGAIVLAQAAAVRRGRRVAVG